MNILILCNGEPPPKSLLEEQLQWADLFIAADGGGNTAHDFGYAPDIVIGDLDSYHSRPDAGYPVIHDPDQYSNDLEKALKLAQHKGGSNIVVLAATGLRLDQTLKNLSVLKQFDAHFNRITFEDAKGTTFLAPNPFSQSIPVGTTVSLFPLSGRVEGITTKGLKYPLKDSFLENGHFDGSSNEVVVSPVSIQHKKGDLLLYIAK